MIQNVTNIFKQIGEEVIRWDLLADRGRDKMSFFGAERGTIESVVVERKDLPRDIEERVTIVVRWEGPLTIGDSLVSLGQPLGVVEAIVDDGDVPRVYTPHATGMRSVTRVLPTARQRVFMRSIGPYDLTSQAPLDGLVMREDQLLWLARSGGRAIVSEMSVYTTREPLYRTRVYETMVKGEPIVDGWTETHPTTPSEEIEGL